MDLEELEDHRKLQLNVLNEIHNKAYDKAWIYKKKTEASNDKMILGKNF